MNEKLIREITNAVIADLKPQIENTVRNQVAAHERQAKFDSVVEYGCREYAKALNIPTVYREDESRLDDEYDRQMAEVAAELSSAWRNS